jgi:hypothetical protein
MNVNELADLIEFDAPIVGINKEAADMLRQLQAECDRLYRIIELNGKVWERIANERCGGKDEDSSRHRNK